MATLGAGTFSTQTGQQEFVGGAPLNLIYVAHGERILDVKPEERRLDASVDSGFACRIEEQLEV
jgi:hypothetical protein